MPVVGAGPGWVGPGWAGGVGWGRSGRVTGRSQAGLGGVAAAFTFTGEATGRVDAGRRAKVLPTLPTPTPSEEFGLALSHIVHGRVNRSKPIKVRGGGDWAEARMDLFQP